MGRLIKAREQFTESQLAELVAALEGSRLVCMATDTVYGLSCLARSGEALERLRKLKGAESRPFLLLVGDRSWVDELCADIPACARRLMTRYWPGPLTLVLKAAERVPGRVRGPRETVALRQPGSPLCRQLLLKLGGPLVSTSANLSGEPPCVTGEAAARTFLKRVELVVDSGRAPAKKPSTMIDVTLVPPTVLREGSLRVNDELLALLADT
ncbi:MAG: threonylcarbamoyl-AMP synthase [Candidatus Eiseniibacteriota bacterium]|nr:MAG: threonylcarbamoyl-AMP synthase [Candidatus Eisenbacteria bacterium]